ncbi:MAG: hypothetical protein Athens041674_405 [Parcubacteria group bacterium Athens0416_74]|nr:MAG: hypothetical protein Athens041674_405 [Parcubacteria group bacterium Athens0416_74]
MKKVVTIGGGSGSYTILQGLKEFPLDITAVVTMFDSGGSSGILRDEMGILPPGDVRRCLVALSDETQQKILRDLFNFRFEENGSMSGHSFGNLFLAALSSIYGSDIAAIQRASELLDLKGKVLPVSVDKSHLHAELEDGTKIVGETNIDIPQHDGNLRIQNVFLEPPAHIYEETDRAIREADLIVIGPGDLYTSLVPNLLVDGMSDALKSRKGKVVVVCNLMTKWGETAGFAASDFVRELLKYSGLPKFDYVLCNTAPMDVKLVKAYEAEKKQPLMYDDALNALADKVITGGYFSEADIARHDSEKVARTISEL